MFLLYHSEGCNIYKMVLLECYINDLHTTTYSGILGHHRKKGEAILGLRCALLQRRAHEESVGGTWEHLLFSRVAGLLRFDLGILVRVLLLHDNINMW
jgi:hypothetical protein